jgi:nitric oxide reductase subunit C
MGCHTILGEGAYYAPELTKVYDRRGEAFIKSMLKDPQAMYPGQRKMTNYNFTDDQINDLTEFLKWIGTMDLNGFPPKPDLAQNQAVAVSSKPKIYDQVCAACHSLNGVGGVVGPALDNVGNKYDQQYLTTWLRDPASVKPGTTMPKLTLSDSEVNELVAFLSSLKGELK